MFPRPAPRLTRRGLATLGAATLLPGLRAQADTPLTVRIGFASIGVDNRPFAGGSPAGVAHAEGYLERAFADRPGLRLQWFFFKGAGPAVNEAFANDQLDIAIQGDLPQVVARATGLKTTMLLANGAHAPTYIGVPPTSTLTGVKDLKGRRVAIFRGTNNHLAIIKVLAANGLSERDLKVINMDAATSSAALVAGEIEATVGNYDVLQLVAKGLARILYSTKGDNPAFERQGTVIAREAFVTAQPEVTQRIVTEFVRAAHWSSQEENREALFAIWARSGRSPEIFREDLAGQTLKSRHTPLLDPFLIEQYRVQAQQAYEFGLIRRRVDITGWFDQRFITAALAELGLQDFWTPLGIDGQPVARG
ncbi:Alkanesulfonates-binding protein [Rhodovastum atsumiense]|uniref:Nitrate ABC transporter substrate-binding protein n=1 Tax=Rhodovastum atsumiense TaxID=504468 RepID=A0A5M6IJX5_9PROT|nr:ABC transporter substrate-binding protein [Rhodovastum atsumiense]KAA5608574.1 nitrate ABC transporter substrate-binding protein [Rhodovastum atsumiense]CAH2598786.1 Alkanesulfonates-binding protein [Rhodovastum atsumiense]